MAMKLKSYLVRSLEQLKGRDMARLVDDRYEKFRKMGAYLQRMDDDQILPVGSPTFS